MRKLFVIVLLFATAATYAQKNFTFSPEKPKPGDDITFTYEPGGDIANTLKPVEGVVYYMCNTGSHAEDLVLDKHNGKYTGTIKADTGAYFIYIGFSADGKFDNNFNEGYYIHLYENDEPRKGSYFGKSGFYQSMGYQVGLERNNEKALEAIQQEFAKYPENKKKYLSTYTRLLTTVKKDQAPALVQAEIESLLKAGLKEEVDYENLASLYTIAKLPEQSKLITSIKKEKFPNGNWVVSDFTSKFFAEKDLTKKKALLAELITNAENGGDKWKNVRDNLNAYKQQYLFSFVSAKDWNGIKNAIKESGITDKMTIAQIYNSAAWEMQKTNDNLAMAEEFSRIATAYAKENMKSPMGKRPSYLTQKQWVKQSEYSYGIYADTYAMVLYRMGEYKKGLPYAKESALVINKGKDPEQNNTYVLLAEKSVPAKKLKAEIEQFVKDGKSTSEMKDVLKRLYIKEKKSDEGFDDYIAALQKENYMKMLEELRKAMLNEAAPSFALMNLDGKKVNIQDLKGKVVIVDFWATWCGPCKASFPGMQKIVEKYKNDQNVKFVFIDTWERGEDKEKNAKDFITTNKYTFDVLMDNEDKVVAQFKVDGIPTKFVIDKEGMIRFKSVGFDGSDDKLISELTAMIELAGEAKKAF